MGRWSKADRRFEPGPAAGDQIVARICRPGIAHGVVRLGRPRCSRHGPMRDLKLSEIGTAREVFNGAPVEIARREIHVPKGATGFKHVVDQADAFEQLRPIHIRDETHAGDNVAHRDATGHLPLVLVADDGVSSRSRLRQLVVKPL